MNSDPSLASTNAKNNPDAGTPSGPMYAVMSCAFTPSQLRAARSMLDWSRSDLAKEAKISAETIKNIEHGVYIPQKSTMETLVATFARRGIQFVRYETAITIPAGCDPVGHTLALSYTGVVRVTAFVPEIREEGHE